MSSYNKVTQTVCVRDVMQEIALLEYFNILYVILYMLV